MSPVKEGQADLIFMLGPKKIDHPAADFFPPSFFQKEVKSTPTSHLHKEVRLRRGQFQQNSHLPNSHGDKGLSRGQCHSGLTHTPRQATPRQSSAVSDNKQVLQNSLVELMKNVKSLDEKIKMLITSSTLLFPVSLVSGSKIIQWATNQITSFPCSCTTWACDCKI